jgi:multiple sugar transport system substrate-binding protein
MVRTGPVENKWEQQVAIPHFQKMNPEISIKLLNVPGADFDAKIYNLVAAGIPPDVWSQWGNSTNMADYAWHGLTTDLAPYIKSASKDYADLYPGALKWVNWNGQQLSVPCNLGGTYTFYNMDIFDKAKVPYPSASWDDKSWNWNEMLRVAKELTRNYNDPTKATYGITAPLGGIEEHVWLWGGDVYEPEAYITGVPHTTHFNTPMAIEAIQAYADLTWVHKVSPSPSVVSAFAGTSDPFLTGRLAMTATGIWGFWVYKDAPFRWGAAALPGMYSNHGGIYADPWLISKRSKNPDAAWQFVKYLTTTQGAREYMQATNAPVPHSELLHEWLSQFKTMTPAQVKTVFDGSLKYGGTHQSIQNCLVAYDRIYNIVHSEFDPVMLGQAKVKDVAPVVDQKLQRFLKRLHP